MTLNRSMRLRLRRGGYVMRRRKLRQVVTAIREVRDEFDAEAGEAEDDAAYDDGGLWEVLMICERLIEALLPERSNQT